MLKISSYYIFVKKKKNLEAKYCIIRKIQVFENAKSQISNLIIWETDRPYYYVEVAKVRTPTV